jgi:hypothetical protein
MSYSYPIKADLLGPPPPAGVSIADGDTLFVVNWTPNTDPDTAGYAVYIDPIPGQEGPVSDAGAGNCGSQVLWGSSSSIVVGSSAPVAQADADMDAQMDDSGNPVEAATTTTPTSGAGISLVDPHYLRDLNSSTGSTVSGISTGTYTVTGLKNGVYYNVAVSAVDGSGNIGPPSPQSPTSCDFPAPVSDFWRIYRTDGGGAGGGFCALEAVGAPVGSTVLFGGLGAAAVAVVRRRRRRR